MGTLYWWFTFEIMMILKIDPNEVRWFAMSSPYCREMKAKELLDRHGIKNFIPMVRKQVVVDDELETKETPAIHNFIFVHDSYNGIMAVKKGLAYLQFILAPNSPLIVPDRQMEDFIRFYESGAYQEPEFLDVRQMSELRPNAKVVIGDGPFEGLEGYFQRVTGAKNKRFVISLDGVMALACKVECKFVKRK